MKDEKNMTEVFREILLLGWASFLLDVLDAETSSA